MFLFPSPLNLTKALYARPLVLTLQQNGVIEHKNRHLPDVAQAFLFHIHVPKRFWSDSVLTECHLVSKMPSTLLDGASPSCFLPLRSSLCLLEFLNVFFFISNVIYKKA
jgi:hypothetical protein